jgi:serine/threonine-protein kinase RsbW
MISLQVPATAESLETVASLIRRLSPQAGLAQQQEYALRLAVEELLINIADHGAGAGSTVTVEAGAEGGRLWIRLIDSGPPFDPTRAADPPDLDRPLEDRNIGGLGIYLTRQMIDEMNYAHTEGRNETTLAMRGR